MNDYLDPDLFVVPLEPDDVCQICHLALEDVPNLMCGHSFHRACLVEWMCEKHNLSCPSGIDSCAPLPDPRDLQIIHSVNTRLARSEIRCPHEACGRKMVVGVAHENLRTHLERECAHHRVPCKYCSTPQIMSEKEKHESSECTKRLVSCESCCTTETIAEMDVSHPLGVCPHLVECPNGCRDRNAVTMVPTRLIEKHVSEECPRRRAACGVCKQSYRVNDREEHMNANISHLCAERELWLQIVGAPVLGRPAKSDDIVVIATKVQNMVKKPKSHVVQQRMLQYLEARKDAGLKQLAMRPIAASTFSSILRLPIQGILQQGLLGPLNNEYECRLESPSFYHGGNTFKLQCIRAAGGSRVSVFLWANLMSAPCATLSYSLWILRKEQGVSDTKISHMNLGHLQGNFSSTRNSWGLVNVFGFFDVWGRLAYDVTNDSIDFGVAFHPLATQK